MTAADEAYEAMFDEGMSLSGNLGIWQGYVESLGADHAYARTAWSAFEAVRIRFIEAAERSRAASGA